MAAIIYFAGAIQFAIAKFKIANDEFLSGDANTNRRLCYW